MKNHLAKFFRSLACRVAIALVTTASFANAHDLPQHFPLAPTDWGMIQQDCMGHRDSSEYSIPNGDSLASSLATLPVAQPDAGSPPTPTPRGEPSIASTALIGPELYDGVDCAHLESLYRTPPSSDLVEYKPSDLPTLVAKTLASVGTSPNTVEAEVDAEGWQFHKSHFAACTCDFENRQAAQIVDAPVFVFERICIADYFASLVYRKPTLVLRDWQPKQSAAPNFMTPLALAVPAKRGTEASAQNKARLADAFSELATWDCVIRGELYQMQAAAKLGDFAGEAAKSWFASVVPSVSNGLVSVANQWQAPKSQLDKRELAHQLVSAAPQFIIYRTASGNEVAIPIAHARNFAVAQQSSVSPEFQQVVDAANARLQWAGGRLSAAASVMNDWFSQRVARVRANELR